MEYNVDPATTRPNRIRSAMATIIQQEAKHRAEAPRSLHELRASMDLVRQHYLRIVKRYGSRRELSKEERVTRAYLKHQIKVLNAKLRPTWWRQFRYSNTVNDSLQYLRRNRKRFKSERESLSAVESRMLMNTNIPALQTELKKKGFDQNLEDQLRDNIAHGLSEFNIRTNSPHVPNTDFLLNFKKVKGTDTYYFAGFTGSHTADLDAVIANDPRTPRFHFPVTDKLNLTAKEAGNFLAGRPIGREVDGRMSWMRFDEQAQKGFIASHFDLNKALSFHSLRETEGETATKKVIHSLMAGNTVDINLLNDGAKPIQLRVSVNSDASGLQFTDRYGQPQSPAEIQQRVKAARKMVADTQMKTAQKSNIDLRKPRTRVASHV